MRFQFSFLTFRNSAVEFSFFVLADSGAFVTQAPKKLIPADVIFRQVRPSMKSDSE